MLDMLDNIESRNYTELSGFKKDYMNKILWDQGYADPVYRFRQHVSVDFLRGGEVYTLLFWLIPETLF